MQISSSFATNRNTSTPKNCLKTSQQKEDIKISIVRLYCITTVNAITAIVYMYMYTHKVYKLYMQSEYLHYFTCIIMRLIRYIFHYKCGVVLY